MYLNRMLLLTIMALTIIQLNAQNTLAFADSIRIKYKIPELAYAVVQLDSILEIYTLGVKRITTNYTAEPNDRFHIGSNTKAITSFIAALMVEQGKIQWDTKFITLFPELKSKSRKEYWTITLKDLLTFRGKVPRYTYTFPAPTSKEIKGSPDQQRYLLAQYFLAKPPMKKENGITPSNMDYVLAGLMLEKASGISYKELVTNFGKTQGIHFQFDYPNLSDSMQPWGHDANLTALAPMENEKLNWLLAAGNINVSLPEYCRFIQLQLKGLKGVSSLLTAEQFNRLLFGEPYFAYGWFNRLDEHSYHHAFNTGNAGAFITQVEIIQEKELAFIVFTNSFTPETNEGITLLLDELKRRYNCN